MNICKRAILQVLAKKKCILFYIALAVSMHSISISNYDSNDN